MSTVIEKLILELAAELIEENGLYKGGGDGERHEDPKAPRCALNSIGFVAKDLWGVRGFDAYSVDRALDRLRKLIEGPWISDWSDSHTKEEVVTTLREAAK